MCHQIEWWPRTENSHAERTRGWQRKYHCNVAGVESAAETDVALESDRERTVRESEREREMIGLSRCGEWSEFGWGSVGQLQSRKIGEIITNLVVMIIYLVSFSKG